MFCEFIEKPSAYPVWGDVSENGLARCATRYVILVELRATNGHDRSVGAIAGADVRGLGKNKNASPFVNCF
jgi:hypothetical protein